MELISRQINEHLKRSEQILIVPHQNPDGDALGSASALAEYLLNLGRSPKIFCPTPLQKKYNFLPHLERISVDEEAVEKMSIDVIVVLDSGDLRYAGIEKLVKSRDAAIINIDHHPTNELYGNLNLVRPGASATAEILFNFFKHNRAAINHRMATALLTGIVTDTDNFSNPATSPETLAIASQLLRLGGNLRLINYCITRNKSVNLLKLWGVVLSRLTKYEKPDLVYTYILQEDFAKHDLNESESEGIANFLNNLENVKASLILKETKEGKIKGSFRTTRDEVDVASWAKKLGGGGHKKAAGFTADGTIQEVLNKILTSV